MPGLVDFFKKQFDQKNSILFATIIYGIGGLLVKVFCEYTKVHEKYLSKVQLIELKKHNKCYEFFEFCRGNNYNLQHSDMNGNVKETETNTDSSSSPSSSSYHLITGWNASHVLLYGILGFVAPDLWWLYFVVSIYWELFEVKSECHDMMDLIWNSLGLLSGMTLRNMLFP